MCSNLISHLDGHNILTDFQCGFRAKRSCQTQLLITINELAGSLDKRKQVDCILLDFSKAFDKVSHARTMVSKIKSYNGLENFYKTAQRKLSLKESVPILFR